MNKNMNELFKLYTNEINKEREASNRRVEALQSAFELMVKQGYVPETELEEVTPITQEIKVEMPTPIIEDKVEDVPAFKLSGKTHAFSMKLNKDPSTYSLESGMKSSKFTNGYGLDHMKELTVSAGRIYVRVEQDSSFRYTFVTYKNDVEIGTVHICRDSMSLVPELEIHPGCTIALDTELVREEAGSIFTSMKGTVVEIIKEDEYTNKLIEEAKPSFDLGEMNMDDVPVFL